jgi:hypothetical protein
MFKSVYCTGEGRGAFVLLQYPDGIRSIMLQT